MTTLRGGVQAWRVATLAALGLWVLAILAAPVLAADPSTAGSTSLAAAQPRLSPDYQTFFGGNSRLVIWIITQLHLMFGAFVLGVPIFASIAEIVGWRGGDARYDRLAHEFTALLSAAFSTTAAFGGLLVFSLFGLYPTFMAFLTSIFHTTYYLYGLLFFAEGFTLYLYYYGWGRMQGRWKGLHVLLGILLNLWGTLLMLLANAWVSYMMTPSGIDQETFQFVGTTWQAVANPLWIPLAIHRFIANIAFGGFIVGAYAAVRFLGARSEGERAHYDWMGYVGNFVGLAALIPLPFAGYYLGREVYSASPVMGNNMMGGAFSWTFIIQAILIGMLFIGGNYYLWSGMGRISGAERYQPYIKYINVILLLCFAIWLTPRNIPLTGEEQLALGGQFHPFLKYFGLMSAKNAAVNLIILSTFFSFLIYRRGNKGSTRPFAEHGAGGKIVLAAGAAVSIVVLAWYARGLLTLDPEGLDLSPDRARYFALPAYLLLGQIGMVLLTGVLTLWDRGKVAQALFFASTILASVFVLGIYGFVIMEKANPFLRNLAVAQWLMVMVCLLWNTTIDLLLFRGAEVVGGIRWGRMPVRSQYALILLCVAIVLLMGLMGFIRSGLREDWHVYAVLQDTSAWAFTPTMAYMARVVGGIVLLFLGLVTFVFWLAGLGEKKEVTEALVPESVHPLTGGTRR
ncbi:MAG: cytochrome ubiquinol oxidase subunit I [Candidatus Methylomirabilales bacterium]